MFHKLVAFTDFFNNEEGQDMVEYALLLGFVVLASVAITISLGGGIGAFWTAIANRLASTN